MTGLVENMQKDYLVSAFSVATTTAVLSAALAFSALWAATDEKRHSSDMLMNGVAALGLGLVSRKFYRDAKAGVIALNLSALPTCCSGDEIVSPSPGTPQP